MKILFVGSLMVALAAAGYAQSKVMAEQVRSTEKIVKGSPFSADAVSESVQNFADGNKIIRSSTSRLFRDSEGRFRRDDMPKQIGLPGAIVEVPQSILIIDPVSGSKFILDTKHKTARELKFGNVFDMQKKFDMNFKLKMEMKRAERAEKATERAARQDERLEKMRRGGKMLGEAEQKKEIEKKAEAKHEKEIGNDGKKVVDEKSAPEKPATNNAKTESLGVKNFEGVEAEGTRTTTTIPAGAIGNLRTIEVVYEKWYSKDLQLIVFATHSDPAFGEQTYKLTNIRRAEPPITLFSPPADYRIISERGPKPPNPSVDSKKPMPKLPPASPAPNAPPKP